MSTDTRLYISLESHAGQLTVDGPITLWRELLRSVGTSQDDPVSSTPDERIARDTKAEAVE